MTQVLPLTNCARCRVAAPVHAACAGCGMWTRTPAPSPVAERVAIDRVQRPMGVSILAILSALSGVGGLAGAVALGRTGVVPPNLPPVDTALAGALGPVYPVLVGLYAVPRFAFAYGFWKGRAWGWTLGLWLLGLAMVLGMLDVANGMGRAMLPLALNGVVAYYLMQPEVKAWFGQKSG